MLSEEKLKFELESEKTESKYFEVLIVANRDFSLRHEFDPDINVKDRTRTY